MSAKLLTAYRAERDGLLREIVKQAQADPRIVAAWLFGSLGRGSADPLSDLDVWLVVQDAHIQDIVARRRELAAAVATPVLLLEAPQNAPRSGGYLLAVYDAPTAPHQVDWYWQPQSQARVPADTRLLFDRGGLQVPRDEAPARLEAGEAQSETIEEPLNSISFFWAMLMICAKNIYRAPHADLSLLRYVIDALRRVQGQLGLETTSRPVLPALKPAAAKLDALRQLGQEMEALTRRATNAGLAVPEQVAPAALRYVQFIESLLPNRDPNGLEDR